MLKLCGKSALTSWSCCVECSCAKMGLNLFPRSILVDYEFSEECGIEEACEEEQVADGVEEDDDSPLLSLVSDEGNRPIFVYYFRVATVS